MGEIRIEDSFLQVPARRNTTPFIKNSLVALLTDSEDFIGYLLLNPLKLEKLIEDLQEKIPLSSSYQEPIDKIITKLIVGIASTSKEDRDIYQFVRICYLLVPFGSQILRSRLLKTFQELKNRLITTEHYGVPHFQEHLLGEQIGILALSGLFSTFQYESEWQEMFKYNIGLSAITRGLQTLILSLIQEGAEKKEIDSYSNLLSKALVSFFDTENVLFGMFQLSSFHSRSIGHFFTNQVELKHLHSLKELKAYLQLFLAIDDNPSIQSIQTIFEKEPAVWSILGIYQKIRVLDAVSRDLSRFTKQAAEYNFMKIEVLMEFKQNTEIKLIKVNQDCQKVLVADCFIEGDCNRAIELLYQFGFPIALIRKKNLSKRHESEVPNYDEMEENDVIFMLESSFPVNTVVKRRGYSIVIDHEQRSMKIIKKAKDVHQNTGEALRFSKATFEIVASTNRQVFFEIETKIVKEKQEITLCIYDEMQRKRLLSWIIEFQKLDLIFINQKHLLKISNDCLCRYSFSSRNWEKLLTDFGKFDDFVLGIDVFLVIRNMKLEMYKMETLKNMEEKCDPTIRRIKTITLPFYLEEKTNDEDKTRVLLKDRFFLALVPVTEISANLQGPVVALFDLKKSHVIHLFGLEHVQFPLFSNTLNSLIFTSRRNRREIYSFTLPLEDTTKAAKTGTIFGLKL